MTARLVSLNVGTTRPTTHSDLGITGIDKRPVTGPVAVRGPARDGESGLVGDNIADHRHHGGPDQAVYAYAREDLDGWEAELGRALRPGMFGENLTTEGIDVTGALIGERWRIGSTVVVEVSVPRIPCRVFAGQLGERGWVKTFTRKAVPGAYLRVVTPGEISQGDRVEIVARPEHAVTIGLAFRALTTEPDLLPDLLVAEALPEEAKRRARKARAARD
ncbi:MAG TPA: MOSC domain-containing protein [Amycolatopsis sp.]|nr:MOSC domain-containing protein [Amycolatopsis sp.]